MSGRSAHVRKEKTKTTKEDGTTGGLEHSTTILGEFPIANGQSTYFEHDFPVRHHTDIATIKSGSSGSDHLVSHGAYERVRKPHIPVLVDSGIEKSTFRSLMDKKSEGARKVLSKTFGKKKKNDADPRPETAATIRPTGDDVDDDGNSNFSPPVVTTLKTQQYNQTPEYIRPGPPSAKLPSIPQGPQLKRWVGGGRPAQPWNKLRRDPELWDPHGDTLIILGLESNQTSRPPPSLRLSSHAIEATESPWLVNLLRESLTEESFSMPPSPISSPSFRPALSMQPGHHQPTPPMSESSNGVYDYEGEISYEMNFLPPGHTTKAAVAQYQATTRNVFALLCQPEASLVGTNLYQTLIDLQERLETYMTPDYDAAAAIIAWLTSKDMDDMRDNPSAAAAILAWSETRAVHWEEGWREAYVHSAGMHHRMEATADFRYVSHITKALLDRSSLEMFVRVQKCEARLADFDFGDMWPMMTAQPPPARLSFERMRKFFIQFYDDAFGAWPTATSAGEEQWLTRTLTQKLQKDFGALYNYLVNREVTWDCSEERSGRKWNIIHAGNRSFDADTFDLPFTDLLVAFDNRHRFPHIPHPYPLTPESIPVKNSKENLFKTSKKSPKLEDKVAEKQAALAYADSTNIFLLGADFVSNGLVEAFVRFEKADKAAEIDPFEARRGRWILIYGILQTLASVSVDTPNLRYTRDASYHLSPRMRGCPSWKKNAEPEFEEATHIGSFCWTVRDTWRNDSPIKVCPPRIPKGNTISQNLMSQDQSFLSSAPSFDDDESVIDPSEAMSSFFKKPMSPRNSNSRSTRGDHRMTINSDLSTANSSGYGPGVEMLEEWPIREDSRAVTQKAFTKSFSMSALDKALRESS